MQTSIGRHMAQKRLQKPSSSSDPTRPTEKPTASVLPTVKQDSVPTSHSTLLPATPDDKSDRVLFPNGSVLDSELLANGPADVKSQISLLNNAMLDGDVVDSSSSTSVLTANTASSSSQLLRTAADCTLKLRDGKDGTKTALPAAKPSVVCSFNKPGLVGTTPSVVGKPGGLLMAGKPMCNSNNNGTNSGASPASSILSPRLAAASLAQSGAPTTPTTGQCPYTVTGWPPRQYADQSR